MKYLAKIISIPLLALLLFAPSAAAESFEIEADKSKLNLGFAFTNKDILPAPPAIGETPLPNLWQARATITLPGQPGVSPLDFKPAGCLTPVTFSAASGSPLPNDGQDGRPLILNSDYPCGGNPSTATISGEHNTETGAVSVAENDFRFPIMVVPNPSDGSPVPITLGARGALSGEINSETGALSLSGNFVARVLTGLSTNPLGTYCELDLPGLTLSTGVSPPKVVGFVGTPFAEGLDGTGALGGTWNVTQTSTPVGGADCVNVDIASRGLGGIWISSGVAEPAAYPDCPPGTAGNYPDCIALKPSWASVSLAPKKQRVRAGKKVRMSVRVNNTGNAEGTLRVTLRSSQKGKVQVPGSLSVRVGASSSKTVSFWATSKKGKRGSVKITALAAGKKSVATITLR